MSLLQIKSGNDVPNDINVVIEIPMQSLPVKYEVNKDSGILFVDRFLSTPVYYPANYGYIPQTLSEDGDPVDVLVITPVPLAHGVVINCRVVGVLNMSDESGVDAKLIAVPMSKLTKIYDEIQDYQDLPKGLSSSIEHFFTHYKDLEPGKWVKVNGWAGAQSARQEVLASVKRFHA